MSHITSPTYPPTSHLHPKFNRVKPWPNLDKPMGHPYPVLVWWVQEALPLSLPNHPLPTHMNPRCNVPSFHAHLELCMCILELHVGEEEAWSSCTASDFQSQRYLGAWPATQIVTNQWTPKLCIAWHVHLLPRSFPHLRHLEHTVHIQSSSFSLAVKGGGESWAQPL